MLGVYLLIRQKFEHAYQPHGRERSRLGEEPPCQARLWQQRVAQYVFPAPPSNIVGTGHGMYATVKAGYENPEGIRKGTTIPWRELQD